MEEFRRVHLAILLVCAYVLRGLWQFVTGGHVVLFTVCIAGLYLARLMKPKDALEEEIEKLDAKLAASDNPREAYVRPTKFIIPESERSLFTDRQRQYSSLLGGTRAQRRKFLQKKKPQEDEIVDKNLPSIVETPHAEPVESSNVPSQRRSRQFTD
ncbi:unnamed protein product [Aphanomyces euteiches]|uniref:Uncharacterized protein n=1 Tax=Aphanomyces euteiches TaxID=100861 RepID=A0A6G0X710_9STRA|nr:hypothetical protein Ae201684_007792 [Aphanomyces euteiches]KAH9067227.1 hypothetical protein Ae201684P_021391 [Aphanomyces euteiches]KAH9145911.1 hypothetical protein AeRB84_010213 [Aphanomyces euteiches]